MRVALAAVLLIPLMLGLACSGGIPRSTLDTLERLPDALQAAQDAIEAVRPIVLEHTEGDDRQTAETALEALTSLCQVGESLTRDLRSAAENNTWVAWTSKVLMFVGRLAVWLKGVGVPIPDQVITAAEAVALLLPAFADG